VLSVHAITVAITLMQLMSFLCVIFVKPEPPAVFIMRMGTTAWTELGIDGAFGFCLYESLSDRFSLDHTSIEYFRKELAALIIYLFSRLNTDHHRHSCL